MFNVKTQVIEIIRNMPDESSIEEIMAELYFIQKITKGVRELDAGKGIDHKKVMKRIFK